MNRFRTTTVTSSTSARDFRLCRIVRFHKKANAGWTVSPNYIAVWLRSPPYWQRRRCSEKSRCALVCADRAAPCDRSEEHTSELQSRENLVCRLLPENK